MRALIVSTLLFASWPVSAQAAELPLSLDWSAPVECDSRDRVLREVERIVGDVDASGPAHVAAQATVQRLADGRFQVTLVTRVDGARGERTLVGKDCAEVSRGTALILALMINPEASLSEAPGEPGEASEAAEAEAPEPAPQPPAVRPSQEASRSEQEPPGQPHTAEAPASGGQQFLVGLGAVGGIGTLPKASVGGEFRLAWIAAWLVAELQFSGWAARSKSARGLEGAGGEFDLYSANLLFAYRAGLWSGGDGRVGLGVAGKRMRATGFGVTDPGSATGYWAGGVAEASLAQSLGRGGLALRLRAGAELPFNPPRFAIEGVGLVHRMSPVAGFVALGLELQF